MASNTDFSECVFHSRGKCGTFGGKKGHISQQLVALLALDANIIHTMKSVMIQTK